MKRTFFTLMLLISFFSAYAQREKLDEITDSITNEGKALYNSEWASWYGSDIFNERCTSKKSLAGGYFSYETKDNLINIFFSRDSDPIVLASISFKKDFNSNNYKLDTASRKFTDKERDYYEIRLATTKRAKTDTIFKYFKNTSLNIIPLIQNGLKKAYALTGTHLNGVVIFGNDYLINFDKSNEIIAVKSLHKNLIVIYTKKDTGKTVITAMHTHLPQTGDFITATDICTLMLYEKFTTWQTHYVISKNYISIWDCKKDKLVILTMEAWKRISDDQKIRHPAKE